MRRLDGGGGFLDGHFLIFGNKLASRRVDCFECHRHLREFDCGPRAGVSK